MLQWMATKNLKLTWGECAVPISNKTLVYYINKVKISVSIYMTSFDKGTYTNTVLTFVEHTCTFFIFVEFFLKVLLLTKFRVSRSKTHGKKPCPRIHAQILETVNITLSTNLMIKVITETTVHVHVLLEC